MKSFKFLLTFFAISVMAVSCMDADEIRTREEAKRPVEIIKAVKPTNLGIIEKLSVADFKIAIDKEITLVDVRTPEEYTESHLAGSVNINFKKRTFPDYIMAINKDKPVAIYCRSGNRTGKAALIMQSLGFKEVYELGDGFKGWNAAGMEIVTEDNDANKNLQELLARGELKGEAIVGKGEQLNLEEFENLASSDNITLIDLRTPKEFAGGHIEGAVNVDWKNRHFLENILTITDENPIAIYCRSGNRSTRAMFAMRAIGFTEVSNLSTGIKSWTAADKPLKILAVKGDIEHLDVENFNNAILGQVGVLVDVRTPKEYTDAHIPGAINVDYKNRNFRTEAAKLNKEKPVLIYCRSGARSGRAMKILKGMGYKVYNLNKGFLKWKGEGMNIEGGNIHAKDTGEEGC